VSGRTRGAVWTLDTGDRVAFGRDFDGAFFDGEKLIVEFPRRAQDSTPAQVRAVTLSPISTTTLYELESKEGAGNVQAPFQAPRASVWQDGDLLIRVAQTDPKRFDHFLLEVRDVRTNSTLWQSEFNKRRPRFFYLRSGKTLTFVVGDYDEMKEAARQDSALSARIDAIKRRRDKEDSYLLQVYEAKSRKLLGNLLVDTGNLSFRVRSAVSAGDSVFVSD